MSKLTIGLVGLVILAVGAIIFTGSGSDTKTTSTAIPKKIDSIQKELAAGAMLVDVRTAEEFTQEHAVGAVNLPVESVQEGVYPTPDKSKKVFLYCHSGRRAGIALATMKQAGYTNVVNLGGMNDWMSIGGKTTKD